MKTLILAEGTVTPVCSKSYIGYSFYLDHEVNRLNIDFSYDPKKLTDREKAKEYICEGIRSFSSENTEEEIKYWESHFPVLNLLTVSVDDSEGFRGCAHRQSQDQRLFVAQDVASHGFIPGKVGKGMWKVTLNLYGIFTDSCRYKLHIWEGGCEK